MHSRSHARTHAHLAETASTCINHCPASPVFSCCCCCCCSPMTDVTVEKSCCSSCSFFSFFFFLLWLLSLLFSVRGAAAQQEALLSFCLICLVFFVRSPAEQSDWELWFNSTAQLCVWVQRSIPVRATQSATFMSGAFENLVPSPSRPSPNKRATVESEVLHSVCVCASRTTQCFNHPSLRTEFCSLVFGLQLRIFPFSFLESVMCTCKSCSHVFLSFLFRVLLFLLFQKL